MLILAVGGAAFVIFPGEPVRRGEGQMPEISDADAFLAAREAQFPDIRPGEQARIVWIGSPGQRSDLVVVYVHGFSAGPEELRPVPDHVARALGANLIFARLPGHGRSDSAMGEPRAGDWVDDTAQMLHLARQIGDRILVVGTSTGGTLATYAMTEPDMAEHLAGVVLISPNFAVNAAGARLLEAPFARLWVPWVLGQWRSFEPLNPGHARHWTTRYPTTALVTLGATMRATRQRTQTTAFTQSPIPVLVLYSDTDEVVSAAATEDVMGRFEGAISIRNLTLPDTGADPRGHLIAGDILSPAMTGPVTDIIVDWARESAAR